MKRVLLVALALILVLAACAPAETSQSQSEQQSQSQSESGSQSGSAADGDNVLAGKRIAYIYNGVPSDIFKMAFDAAQQEGAALGMTVDIFTSEGDDIKFQDVINQCANQGYDGMFISHGKADYAYDLIKPIVEKGIKVVTFDTDVVDHDGNAVVIDGVTSTSQNDQLMAELLLDYICDVICADITDRPIKLLKVWRGPGVPPFDRRQESYLKFEEAGKIETLEVLAPADPKDGEGGVNTAVAAILPKYPEGTVDAMWVCYDAYARGAYKAMVEAGRFDIPMVSVDISNEDINMMLEHPEIWRACAACHFENVGLMGIRLLAMKLHGDETPETYTLAPSLVTADQLTSECNVVNLAEYVEGYGVFDDDSVNPDWMKELRGE